MSFLDSRQVTNQIWLLYNYIDINDWLFDHINFIGKSKCVIHFNFVRNIIVLVDYLIFYLKICENVLNSVVSQNHLYKFQVQLEPHYTTLLKMLLTLFSLLFLR